MAFISEITPLGSSTTYDLNAKALDKFYTLGDSHPNHLYKDKKTYTTTTIPTTNWWVCITLNRTWDPNLTDIVITASYSNVKGALYLDCDSQSTLWRAYLTNYGGSNILAIKRKQNSSSNKTEIYLKLKQPVEYNGSTPQGTLTVYSPVTIDSIIQLSEDPGELITLRYGYNSNTAITTSSTIYGNLSGNASTATAANLTTTANAIAYYTNTTGTFGSKASANGALYATAANGELQWGTLPVAQGGTGNTSFTPNRLAWASSATKLETSYHYADSAHIAINYNSQPETTFYVNGDVRFAIGDLDTTANKRFMIGSPGNRYLSLGGSGIQAYTASNTASKLYIQYYGGELSIGENNAVTTGLFNITTATMTGAYTFNSANGFTYSGIGTGSDNSSRPVWFSCNGVTGRPVYDNDFKYNPALNRIDLVHANGAKGEYRVTYSSTVDMWMGVGSGNENHGLYDAKAGKWMIYADGSGNVTVNGNAATATADGSGNIITSTYVKKAGDTMTGNLLGNSSNSLGSTANPFHNIVLGGTTDATMTKDSTNPRITFQDGSSSNQSVHLLYTDYDSYRAPAGLKVIGGNSATPAWFEVEGKTYAKALNNLITGTGTAGQDSGSGNNRYKPAKWTFNTGQSASNGDIYIIKLPVAGHDYGIFMSVNNGGNYYPVIRNGTDRLTTHYGNGQIIEVVFDSNGSATNMFALDGGTSRVTVSGGAFRVINQYDSGNTISQIRHENGRVYAGSTGINPYSLVCLDNANKFSMLLANSTNAGTGTSKAINTSGKYKLPAVIYYYGANNTAAANALVSSTYQIFSAFPSLDTRYSHNHTATFATNSPLYIECTIDSNGYWSPTTTCITQTLTAGKYYIYLGQTYSTEYQLTLTPFHPCYYYNGTNLVDYTKQFIHSYGDFVSKSRAEVGISPNFDDPGFTGLFEIRSSSETTGESGTKPFNGFAPFLTFKKEAVMMQLAGSNSNGWWIRGKQAANVTLSEVAWERIYTTGYKPTKSDVGLDNVTNHQQVHEVAWDSTNKKITRSKNGTAGDVVQFVADTGITLTAAADTLTIANAGVTGVKGDAESSYRTGQVNITKGNIGLGNVTNDTQIPKSIGTTKGDIIYWSAANTPVRLGIGSAGYILKTSSSSIPTWSASPFHTALTSKGTTATTAAGETYGVAGVATGSNTTIYTKWYVNLDSGITTPFNGMMIQIKIPVAGVNAGCAITIDNGSNFYPVSINVNGRITTHFGVNDTITLQFDSARAVAAYGTKAGASNGNATVNITGCWRILDSYDTGYSTMSVEEMRTGTATTQRVIRADYLKTFLSTLGGTYLTLSHTSDGIVLNHDNSGVTAGTYGSATQVPKIVVDAQGHVTSVTATTISGVTPASHSHGNITNAGELSTANRAVITDENKKITISSVTSTELGYLSGTTSAIQTQLNAKAPLASPALTGTPTAPTAAAGTNTTQIATTEFVTNAVAQGFVANDAMVFKGLIGSNQTITQLPTSGYNAGWTYRVADAGTFAGEYCEVGDLLIAINDGPTSGSSVINTDWGKVEHNIDGAVFRGSGASNSSVGSSTQPVYVNASGVVTAITGAIANDTTGNAATATKLASTPNNTTTFLRGDNTWSNTLTGDFNVNGNTTLSGETEADSLTAGNLQVNGSATFVNTINGNVATATALTSNAGGARNPIYFSGGKPFAGEVTFDTLIANRLVWTSAANKPYAGYHYANSTQIAINSSTIPTEVTDYNFYAVGKSYFKHSGGSSARPIVSGTRTAQHLSIGNAGFQAYNNDSASILYLNYYGGQVDIGSANTTTAVRNFYGQFDFKSSTGFTYSGITAASEDVARPVWFSYCSGGTVTVGRPGYDNDFKYNPSTNVLTVGSVSGSASGGIPQNVTNTSQWRKVLLGVTEYAAWNTAAAATTGISYQATNIAYQPTTGTLKSTVFATGNLIIGGAVDTDAGKTISSFSTLYLKTTGNSSIIFTTNGTIRSRVDAAGHLRPEVTNTYDLGTSDHYWRKLYVTTAAFSGTSDSTHSKDTNAAVVVKGGVSVEKKVSAKEVRIDNNQSSKGVSLQYDASLEVLNFVFS